MDKFTRSTIDKFGITDLNPMQKNAGKSIRKHEDVVILSPTGTGKTLAFLLPLIEQLDPDCDELQVLILAPSRELAQQIEQVARKMGSGFKINAVYGGRAGSLDKLDLKHRPAILVGTPGRVIDRFQRDELSLKHIKILILDEFDKSLEIGFKEEMKEIIAMLPHVKQRILTSATHDSEIPKFTQLNSPVFLDYLNHTGGAHLKIKRIISPEKDKLPSLEKVLKSLSNLPGIVFCNFKDALGRVSEFLDENQIHHECFHGGMEQRERELALVKFRNGTSRLLLSTDLAARGLDIPEIKFILHYHLPHSEKEFTHRNGRTARMNAEGIAYILQSKDESLPDFIQSIDPEVQKIVEIPSDNSPSPKWTTLHITGGRRDKISKSDIAGLFFKQGRAKQGAIGVIEVQQQCAFVGVHAEEAETLIERTNNTRLKTKKVRISKV